MRLQLRPYQLEALDRVAAAEARGVRKQLIQAATGLGKTVMFVALAERRQARTVILAHRDELVAQAAAKVRELWPDADVGIVKAEQNDVSAQVVIASVQTLARERRLRSLVESQHSPLITYGDFELVIVDEAHHTTATTYRSVLAGLRAGEPDGPLLLGVTATPDRGDGKGLDKDYDEIVATYDLLWGIRSGFLSDVRGLAVKVASLDLSSVKVSKGDYEVGAAGVAMERAGAEVAVVRAWKQHANDRRTIVFTPTVRMAQLVAAEYQAANVQAAWLSGETPTDERRAILRGYSHGELQVVVNCAVLTEGFDEPRTDCIVVARPTKSRALYTQMVGRGTRRHPDKADCLVLDIVGASIEHSLVTMPSLFGVQGKYADRLRDGSAGGAALVDAYEDEQVRIGNLRAVEVDLFKQLRKAAIAWVPVRRGLEVVAYSRPLGGRDDETVRIVKYSGQPLSFVDENDRSDLWEATVVRPGGDPNMGRSLIFGVPLEMAQGVAEDYVRKNGVAALTRTDAPWRKRPPSDKMVAAAKKWRVQVDPKWNAGEVSDAINEKIASRGRGRAS